MGKLELTGNSLFGLAYYLLVRLGDGKIRTHWVRVRAVTLCPFCPLKCPFSPFETPFIEHFDNDVFFQFCFNFVISFLL